ncbi:MAG: hypothetical protein ACREBV_02950 [Candidatus Zixiibacteriota bacterium]
MKSTRSCEATRKKSNQPEKEVSSATKNDEQEEPKDEVVLSCEGDIKGDKSLITMLMKMVRSRVAKDRLKKSKKTNLTVTLT